MELESGKFQKLADSYLIKKGYRMISATGSVAGSNKTKQGTPDALFKNSNNKYVLAEYTTQRENIFHKFNEDIDKCLNKSKTDIAVGEIAEIVLCCNSEMSAREINQLDKKCDSAGINFSYFGLSAISNDLYERHPDIAEDYLSIKKDTRQIISLDRFIELNEKNKFSSFLANFFCAVVEPNATLYHFGIITSNMHMVWMKYSCGRLESRYRYSNQIVYNNFPFPQEVSETKKEKIKQLAQAVLDTRKEFPDNSLADLYDPNPQCPQNSSKPTTY